MNSAGDNVLTVNDTAKPATLGWSESMTATSWAHVSGNTAAGSDVGYVFPDLPAVAGLRASRTDNWKSINTNGTTNTATSYTRHFLSLALEQVEGFEPLQTAPVALPALDGSPIDTSTGGIKGKRPSKKDKLRAAAARSQ